MKKIILPLLFLFSIIACEKEDMNDLKSASIKAKIDVCHYSEEDGTWHLISIPENAWKAHEAHGDVRLDDQDSDGFVPDNECGYGNMGDLDDSDPDVNPDANATKITGIRLGTKEDEANMMTRTRSMVLLAPFCIGQGMYIASYYITGTNLPLNKSDYRIFVNGIDYDFSIISTSSEEVIVGVWALPVGEKGVDVKVLLAPDIEFEAVDLYDAPDCL